MTPAAGLTAAAAFLLAACSSADVETAAAETRDPAAIPSGSIHLQEQPTGPIVELGSGRVIDVGWRYVIYPVDEEWCTQLETALTTVTDCGDQFPAGDDVFAGVGNGTELGGGITLVEGVVVDEAATVWVVLEDGLRVPAILMPLDEAGLEGQAFVALLPEGRVATHLQALALNGAVLDTYELPEPPD